MFTIIAKRPTLLFNSLCRFSTQKAEREVFLASLIASKIKHSDVLVQDMSEGNQEGVKYMVYVESETFRDTSAVEQHNLVKNALKKEWKTIQSIQIRTKVKPQAIEKAPAPNTPGSTNPDDRRATEGADSHTEPPRAMSEVGTMPIGVSSGDGEFPKNYQYFPRCIYPSIIPNRLPLTQFYCSWVSDLNQRDGCIIVFSLLQLFGMNSYQSIFVVSEHCTQQELSEISPLTTLGSSCMTSRIESYISHPNSSFININIARIGLERLSRVIKMKIRQFKRNSLEAIKIVSVVDKESKREHQSKNQSESRRRQGLEKSKSESKIELKRGERDRAWKYEDKLVLKSFIIEEEGEPVSSSKASLYKTGEKCHVSTQQSSTKKVSEGMYFKKLRQNIMNIKTQLNQIQKVNHDLHAENQRLKSIKRQQDIAHHSSRNRSTPSHTFFHPQSQYLSLSSQLPPPICSPPVYITTPANNCTRCGDRFVPPMKIISNQRNCLGCAYY